MKRKILLVVFVVISCLLPITIIFGQTQNPDDSVIATLTRKLLAQETRIARQDFMIDKMGEVIQASTDTTLVGKLKAFGIKVQ